MLDLGVETLKVIEALRHKVPSIIIKNIFYRHCLLRHTSLVRNPFSIGELRFYLVYPCIFTLWSFIQVFYYSFYHDILVLQRVSIPRPL